MASTFTELIDQLAQEHGLKADEDRIYDRDTRLRHVNEARDEMSRAFPRLTGNRVEGTLSILSGTRVYPRPDRYLASLVLYRLGDDGSSWTVIQHITDVPLFRYKFPDPTATGTVYAYTETEGGIVVGFVPNTNETLQWVYLAARPPKGDGDDFDTFQTKFEEALRMRALIKSASWLETPPEQEQRWISRLAKAERGLKTREKSLEFEDLMIRRKEPGWAPTRWED